MRYSVQTINSKTDGKNYRVTDNTTDSRIATCYIEENAELICKALNFYEKSKTKNNKKA